MFTLNLIVADDVLEQTNMTQQQLDNVLSGIQQAASLWSRYIDGNNAVIDIALDFRDLSGSTLAQAGSSFFGRNGGPFQSEVITELNGEAGAFSQDGTFTVDLPNILNDRFFFTDSLVFEENPGGARQIDFLTLAAHELGHVLGFLGLSFEGFVENNTFIGENAIVANGGVGVALADGVHTDGDDLLSPSISSNQREPLNAVHIAILQDLGVGILEATNVADALFGFNEANDVLRGQGGDDVLNGLSGDDRLLGGSGNDTLIGEAGEDFLVGLSGNDELFGGSEADFLFGGTGNDNVFGQSGADNLRGNRGNDIVDGGSGNDIIRGGGGSSTGDGFVDVFVFDQGYDFDSIRDFENGLDQLDLSTFNFYNFSEVEALAQDRSSGLRLDFGGGDILFVINLSQSDFDVSDVIL